MSAPDITLIGIAEGSFPASEAEARAMAAEVLRLRAELAALRAPQDGYITTSRPGAAIEVQERVLSPEEIAALDFGRKPFGGGR